MINVSFNLASLCGLVYFVGSFIYIVSALILIFRRARNVSDSSLIIYVIQAIVSTIFFLIIGMTLLVYGWRFDPIMQLGQFLQTALVIYIIIKDMLMTLNRSR